VCIHANFFHIQHFDGRNLSQVTLSNRFCLPKAVDSRWLINYLVMASQ
jgi:hypothetical protein